MHAFIYQLKILLRNKSLIFWSIIFPLCLASFFKMAFSDLLDSESYQKIPIAYVEEKENSQFKQVIDYVSQKDHQLFDVQYVSYDQAKTLLKDEKISGYYLVDDDIHVYLNQDNIDSVIIQTIANQYQQSVSTMTNIYQFNPEIFYQEIVENIDLQKNHFTEKKINHLDLTVIYFYTLIGMSCLNGGTWSITVHSQMEANLSRQGTRLNVAPTSKLKNLIIGLTCAFLIHYVEMLILFGYLIFGLHIDFGNQTSYILLLMAVGCFTGIALGQIVSNLLKTNQNTKVTIFTMLSLIFSFLSGMMGTTDLKYLIQNQFPLLANINPVNLITDALYSLYYYTDHIRYFQNLLILLAIGIVVSILSLLLSRRKKYDYI